MFFRASADSRPTWVEQMRSEQLNLFVHQTTIWLGYIWFCHDTLVLFLPISIDNNRHRCIDIWPARNSRLTQRETNHYISRCASELAWLYLAGSSPGQLVIDLFAQHQRFAVCCQLLGLRKTRVFNITCYVSILGFIPFVSKGINSQNLLLWD